MLEYIGGVTGMAYEDTYPFPHPSPGSWGPYPGFVIPPSFHLKLICEAILLHFDVDLSWFSLDGSSVCACRIMQANGGFPITPARIGTHKH